MPSMFHVLLIAVRQTEVQSSLMSLKYVGLNLMYYTYVFSRLGIAYLGYKNFDLLKHVLIVGFHGHRELVIVSS